MAAQEPAPASCRGKACLLIAREVQRLEETVATRESELAALQERVDQADAALADQAQGQEQHSATCSCPT